MNVIDLEEFRKRLNRCTDVPTSERCTTRLLLGNCPGMQQGSCVSPKLDPQLHNQQLPLFFAAQH